ncbi:CoA ester lyase [Alphaproteobacteria bacterium]|nr:CoA ester lyase [Alphaproteobacteria bacterium]MDC1086570.1 CoA ester lyase [Alphaproteobacteria bacterium]
MKNKKEIQSRRSFIFTPGLKPEMYPKALKSGTDMVCIELEDGIAPQDKEIARNLALKLFQEKQENDGVERILRINSLREKFGIEDVQAILSTKNPPPALMIPKVKKPDEIVLLDNLLSEKGHHCRIHVIIETNEGLENAYQIANCSNRIDALFFGGVDMSAELRCENKWEPLLYARSRIVHAAASAGIDAIDVPYLDLEDLEGMRKEAILAKELGFSGKGSIHPKQIPILNDVFTPSELSIKKAQKIVSVFEKANTGLVVIDGKLIEKPVLREMYRILSIAKKISKK